jgi:hypothetical protein
MEPQQMELKTLDVKSMIANMKPTEKVVRDKSRKATELLQKARNVLNGYMLEEELLIDLVINRLRVN